MVMIALAAIQFFFLGLVDASIAFSRHSAKISDGIILLTAAIPRGSKIRSSTYPKIGIGSGIKSIGLRAYPITQTPKALAYQGVLLSLQAR